MTETTPGPWFATTEDGNWIIRSEVEDRHSVAYVGHDSSETAAGDAELICQAVNAHDALVAALGMVLTDYLNLRRATRLNPFNAQEVSIDAARAALQLARGAS